jgi:hypothetical protein
MNTDLILSNVRTLLKIAGASLVTHGYMSSGHVELTVGAILAVIGYLCSHYTHSDGATDGTLSKTASAVVAALVFASLVTGCTSVLNSSKLISMDERGLGFIATDPSQSAQLKFGFFSQRMQFIPTSTNEIYTPRYMQNFRANKTGVFGIDITDNSGAGDVYIGGTNDVSKAIVPSPFYPQPASSSATVVK